MSGAGADTPDRSRFLDLLRGELKPGRMPMGARLS